MKHLATLLCALCLLLRVGPVHADDPGSRYELFEESHVIQADGTDVATTRYTTRVLKTEWLENAKSQVLSYSASAQDLTVLEAYTLKKDGRRIPVPKRNFQLDTAGGKAGAAAVFSDRNRQTVVFPDLAVGDAVHLSYRLRTKVPLFPGKVSLADSYSTGYAFDKVQISIDYPAGMLEQHKARDMSEQLKESKGRKTLIWNWKNEKVQTSTRMDYSVVDPEESPGWAFSTFADQAEIARAYVERAMPKAAVTPRIRELAERLTQDLLDPRDQAKALYDYAAREITYAGNCVGIGAVVPRSLDFVLDNRMGDCKDHATLLQALLAAKGIASHQVLVNAGDIYRLPSVPTVSMVNHVINYLPTLGLFLDSTDSETPFGSLPLADRDKPVLAASAEVPARTPKEPGNSRQHMRTTAVIAADGSVTGQVEVKLEGLLANNARRGFIGASEDQLGQVLKRFYANARLDGEGSLRLAPVQPAREEFSYSADFTLRKLFAFKGSGGFGIGPYVFNPAPVSMTAAHAVAPAEAHSSFCMSAQSIEDYEITLPENLKILSVPEGTAFSTPQLRYTSRYELVGRVLKVHREVEDHQGDEGNVCSPERNAVYREAASKVLDDLKQQLLYK